jgi:cobalt-zinc-cadmium efflux system membrane fusion protein
MSRKYQSPAITLCFCALLISSCTGHKDDAEDKTPRFQVTDTLLKSLSVDTVKSGGAKSEISLSGVIAPDENKMSKIFPMVSGIVEDVNVLLGDYVKKGQTLAIMRSSEMAGYTKDYVSSEADIKSFKRELESTKELYSSGLASGKDLQHAQSDYDKAVAENKRASSVVAINKSNNKGYELTSPISGYVVEKNLTNNMQVRADNGQNLFTISDLSTVYVLANIYESDISSVQTGDPVKITTLSYPNKVFTGKIDKIYSMIDPDNKVMRARVKIDNPGNLLKPQMFAKVLIQALTGEQLPVISSNALIFDNDRYYVIQRTGPAQVHIQPIVIAKRIEDRVYVEEGLKAGDELISSRQLFLYESLKK